jgi:hypothetical protein
MKHIKKFESHRIERRRENIIKESVLQVNDIYKVRTMVDIPQTLINAYVKKVKDNTGKNLRQFFGDMDIAEEIVKYVTQMGIDVDKLPANALIGGAQGQAQGQSQVQVQVQGEGQVQAQAQTQPQGQAQTQGQDDGGFEDVQSQGQAQAQQPQGQGQEDMPQMQGQAQAQQPQGQSQEEEEDDEEEDNNDLPI